MNCKELNIELCVYCYNGYDIDCMVKYITIQLIALKERELVKEYIYGWIKWLSQVDGDTTWLHAAVKYSCSQHLDMLEKMLVLM